MTLSRVLEFPHSQDPSSASAPTPSPPEFETIPRINDTTTSTTGNDSFEEKPRPTPAAATGHRLMVWDLDAPANDSNGQGQLKPLVDAETSAEGHVYCLRWNPGSSGEGESSKPVPELNLNQCRPERIGTLTAVIRMSVLEFTFQPNVLWLEGVSLSFAPLAIVFRTQWLSHVITSNGTWILCLSSLHRVL